MCSQGDSGGDLVIVIEIAVVVRVPVRAASVELLELVVRIGLVPDGRIVPIEVNPAVGVVVHIDGVWAGGVVRWIGDAEAIAEVIVVPRVGRLHAEPGRP